MEIGRGIETVSDTECMIPVKDLIAEVTAAMSFCPEDISMFQLAAEEACINVVLHAYGEGVDPRRIKARASGDCQTLTFWRTKTSHSIPWRI